MFEWIFDWLEKRFKVRKEVGYLKGVKKCFKHS